jgi:pimeloyl-ACP methyl ester carboxylesterase
VGSVPPRGRVYMEADDVHSWFRLQLGWCDALVCELAMSVGSDSPLLRDWGKYRRPPRRGLPRWIWLLVAISAVAAVGVVVWLSRSSEPWRPPSGSPRFVSCTYGGYVDGWCGRLRVAFDPGKLQGPTISLRVTVLPATKQPAAGALFYLEGGPGRAATAAALSVNAFFAQVGRTRDLVMVDQRGTGGSSRLACPDQYVRRADPGAVSGYLRACFAHLDADPRLYTTSVAADDVETVRRALGYRKIDLYGGSYGATLAQAYMRQYPKSVRSVVLDSGSLPDVRIYDVSARNAERALDAQLARCAAERTCEHAYPHPRRQLGELLARPPRRVTLVTGKVVLRPNDIAWTVASLSETAENAAVIPFAINAAVHGDYTPLASTYAEIGSKLDSPARLVAYWVILCSEPWAAFDPATTARVGRGSYLVRAALARARLFRRACREVPKGLVSPAAGGLRVVRVPVLLLAGSADPLDPLVNLRGWRRLFPHGRLIVVAGAGHGTIEYSCVQGLVARFIEHGSARRLNSACARHVSLPSFATG